MLLESKTALITGAARGIGKQIAISTSFEESELIGYGTKYINKLIADERFADYVLSLIQHYYLQYNI